MRRPAHAWMLFAASLAAAGGALTWLSAAAVRTDRAETRARAQADLEQSVWLALWRMELALAGLISQEAARPYFQYLALQPLHRPYDNMLRPLDEAALLAASPLLTARGPFVRLHFQIDPAGGLTSPQAPPTEVRDNLRAALPELEDTDFTRAEALLAELTARVAVDTLALRLPQDEPARPIALLPGEPPGQRPVEPPQVQTFGKVQQRGESELAARQRGVQQFLDAQQAPGVPVEALPAQIAVGSLRPLWEGDQLLLVRRVSAAGQTYVQGCWLDWPAMGDRLAAEVADVLPGARLEPATHDVDPRERRLAALPLRLVLADEPRDVPPISPALRAALLITWAGVLLAFGAVAALLQGTLLLSERRAAFVSAVTHELRTPLTTFRMYTEMLSAGMVPDGPQRAHYLATLQAEAVRLGHLVENVLAYARLERSGRGAQIEPTPLADLVERCRPRLAERAERGGMCLRVRLDVPDAPPILADPAAVEQILFNLVDNACKYAAAQEGDKDDRRRIELWARSGAAGTVELAVCDRGPGIPRAERRRLFQPFHKSARQAAHSAPGVGLGLALSRRLARLMGGDLRLVDAAEGGACFALSLRRA